MYQGSASVQKACLRLGRLATILLGNI
jgi:hypothetical protein